MHGSSAVLRALLAVTLLTGVAAACAPTRRPAAPNITQVAIHAPAAVTARDYRRAEALLPTSLDSLIYGRVVFDRWLEDGRYAYITRRPSGPELVVADPGTGSVERNAPGSPGAVEVVMEWRRRMDQSVAVSPDGHWGAFRRGHDLWLRDLETGEEYPVTTDGEEGYGYATDNAAWTRSERPVVKWSPDSKRIATFRHDARGVDEMYLTTTEVGRPSLDAWRYTLPGDSVIFRIERLVADVSDPARPEITFLDMPPDPHRGSVCDHVTCDDTFTEVEWADDGASLMFLSTGRYHKDVTLRVADAETGEVRDILSHHEDTFYSSGLWGESHNWRYLPDSDEVFWFTHETDRGHLYLHDLETGRRKHAITEGDWNVLTVERVDPGSRTVWFTGNAREPGNPYHRYLYRVHMDTGGVTLLTPDSAYHEVSFSPDGRHFVDRFSTPETAPVTVLRDARSGAVVTELERADISRLAATGWRPPIPIVTTARDDSTELHGLMFVPSTLDTTKQYPVVNYIYPGPSGGSVRGWNFTLDRRGHQAMAELGFIVVSIDALGSGPERTKSFHEFYYGNLGDNGVPDQIAGIRELAARYGYLDLDRVGVWGKSGGGYASTRAILAYPDFYKVAVSIAGNHDNRSYEDDWGEWWQGPLVEYQDGATNYDNQANQRLAENLKGKLLLAHGMLDDNVPPYSTLLVVQALIEADRDFDLIMFPEATHSGLSMHPYMIRKRWDYFVEHLLGADTPLEYSVGQ